MAKIEDHKYSIEEAFRECFYIVPDYQREYVWTEKEVQQLLDDIEEQLDVDERREYFIRTELVSPTAQKSHYEVIDGQQRLTTFFLLLCALRERFQGEPQYPLFTGLLATSYTDSGGNLRTSLKLDPRYENAGELMNRIVAIGADPETTRAKIAAAGISRFGSLENLLNAYGTIHSYLGGAYKTVAELRQYWGYLANSVVFIQISTDVSSALKIFETINERGIGLNSMDLLKNLLFTQVRPEEFTRLKDEWKKVTAPLEKAKEKPLRFLRYFIMANYKVKNDRPDAVVREDEIYDWLIDKDNAALCNYKADPFGFVRKIIRNVEKFIGFTDGRANDGAPSTAMDPGAWKVADFKSPADYTIELAAAQLRDIYHSVRRIKDAGLGLDDLQREHFELASLRPVIDEIRHQIEDGRGFVVLRRLPVEDYSKDELGMIFWGLGTHLGRGLSQSVLGDRLGHVKDFSREDPLARAYRNKQELSPHTDSCDLVGLACLRDAKSGGVSRLTSALPVHNVMRAECPAALERLYRGYAFHRRGEEQPGELPYTPHLVPVFSNTEGQVSARYVRTYVEAGEAAAGRPMDEVDLAVLDRFEEVSKRPELMLEFTLQPGEMYFINNYTILHARTTFADFEEEDRRRHLLRLWLEVPRMRCPHPLALGIASAAAILPATKTVGQALSSRP